MPDETIAKPKPAPAAPVVEETPEQAVRFAGYPRKVAGRSDQLEVGPGYFVDAPLLKDPVFLAQLDPVIRARLDRGAIAEAP